MVDPPRESAPVSLEEPKPPKPTSKIYTITVENACEQFPDIRSLYVRFVAHVLKVNSVPELQHYYGTPRHLGAVVEKYVDCNVNCRPAEERMDAALRLRHRRRLIPAPWRVEGDLATCWRSGEYPTHKTGPSEFETTVATIFLLKALEKATRPAMMKAAEARVKKAEVALKKLRRNWTPDMKIGKEGLMPGDPSQAAFRVDVMGRCILEAQIDVFAKSQMLAAMSTLVDELKKRRKAHAWLVKVLDGVGAHTKAAQAKQAVIDKQIETRIAARMDLAPASRHAL